MIKGVEYVLHEERLRLFSLEKRRSRQDLINVNKHLIEGNKDEGARLFTTVFTDRKRGNR